MTERLTPTPPTSSDVHNDIPGDVVLHSARSDGRSTSSDVHNDTPGDVVLHIARQDRGQDGRVDDGAVQ